MPSKLRILIVLRGISYDSSYRHGACNFERTYENFFSHMVGPWRLQGHKVDVGLMTYNSKKLAKVVEVYSPIFLYDPGVAYNAAGRTKLNSMVEALQAADNAGGAKLWDFIVMTRFDLFMREPITRYSIDFGKANFLWPEKNLWDEPFEELPRVGDAMQLFNSAYLGALIEGFKRLILLVEVIKSNPSYCNGHRILTVTDIDMREDVHLILNGTFPSRWNKPNPVYKESVSEEKQQWLPNVYKWDRLEKVGSPPVTHHWRPKFIWPNPNAASWVDRLDKQTLHALKTLNKLQLLKTL